MSDELTHHPFISDVDRRFATRKERLARKRKETRLAESLTITVADIAYALRKHKGVVSDAAEFLGTTRAILFRKIDNNPSLSRLRKEIKEEQLDIAEGKLLEQVHDGVFPAISLFLKTQGKDRGYTEKGTVEHELGEGLVKNSAALIEAMRRGVNTVSELESEEGTVWVEVKSTESLDPKSLPLPEPKS